MPAVAIATAALGGGLPLRPTLPLRLRDWALWGAPAATHREPGGGYPRPRRILDAGGRWAPNATPKEA